MERKAEMHAQICSELHELYEAKNADYGDAFSRTFNEYGMVAPLLRLALHTRPDDCIVPQGARELQAAARRGRVFPTAGRCSGCVPILRRKGSK